MQFPTYLGAAQRYSQRQCIPKQEAEELLRDDFERTSRLIFFAFLRTFRLEDQKMCVLRPRFRDSSSKS